MCWWQLLLLEIVNIWKFNAFNEIYKEGNNFQRFLCIAPNLLSKYLKDFLYYTTCVDNLGQNVYRHWKNNRAVVLRCNATERLQISQLKKIFERKTFIIEKKSMKINKLKNDNPEKLCCRYSLQSLQVLGMQ